MQVDTKIINLRCENRARHDRRIHFSAIARRPHPSIPQLTKRQKAKTSDMVLQCSANFISLYSNNFPDQVQIFDDCVMRQKKIQETLEDKVTRKKD